MTKLVLLLVCVALGRSYASADDELKCNLKICGSELLNFEGFNFGTVFRKLEVASFCIKNCTPPVVQEFYQSIIYSITKRIPGHCSGAECVDKNRFLALAKCAEEHAWPLLDCSRRLIDLARVGLAIHGDEEKKNTTCSIVTNTTQCIEETLQRCGKEPFSLVKEIFGDVVKIAITSYCHPAYSKEGLFLRRTTAADPILVSGSDGWYEVTPNYTPDAKHVKGYRSDNGEGCIHTLTHACLLSTLLLSSVYLYQYR